jgi:putative ABC transport system substrate-binding protein
VTRTALEPSRRALLAAVAIVLAAPSLGLAQQAGRTYHIGFPSLARRKNPYHDAYFDELSQHGFIEGANLVVDGQFAIDVNNLDVVAAEMAQRAPDAFVCIGTVVARACKRATSRIPILAYAYDLVGSELVTSLARPDANITGFSIVATDLDIKRQEILMELLPAARHMAVLADPNAPHQVEALQQAASARGVNLAVHWAYKPDDVVPAIEAIAKTGAEALDVLASPTLALERTATIDAAARLRLPAIYQWPETAREGGLVGYGPPLIATYREFARQLVKVLKGAKPSEIPVEQPTNFALVINLKTVNSLGLTVPSALLARADEVIE